MEAPSSPLIPFEVVVASSSPSSNSVSSVNSFPLPQPKLKHKQPHKAVETAQKCFVGNEKHKCYRGVSRHKRTGRYEAYILDKNYVCQDGTKKAKPVYIGSFKDEKDAAHARDLASIKFLGDKAVLNFPADISETEYEEMLNKTKEEYLITLRRKSSGFSKGASKYRGVSRYQNKRWAARLGNSSKNKSHFLGYFDTQEEAAQAYDCAALQYIGPNAVTNFDKSRYTNRVNMEPEMHLPIEMLSQISIMPSSQHQPSSGPYLEPTHFTSQFLQPQTSLQLTPDLLTQLLPQQNVVPQQQTFLDLPQPLYVSQEYTSVECRPEVSQMDSINLFDGFTAASQFLQPQTNLQLTPDLLTQPFLQPHVVPQQQTFLELPQPLYVSQEYTSVECQPEVSQMDSINLFDGINAASDTGGLSWNFQPSSIFNHHIVPETSIAIQAGQEDLYGYDYNMENFFEWTEQTLDSDWGSSHGTFDLWQR